ncbi:SDR family NAD(P)-dependent oxidoreductase [Thiotrichales bacterium HSG1]|nr:SDR family NAD(P)-dependent oxidoreductase [Thiotrichales bacterium HSG1]
MSNSTIDRSILITGCSTGIGYCVAHGLQKLGYRVFATARKPEDVSRLKQEGLESLELDLNDSSSITNAVQKILELTDGKLYALFNNGAYGQPGAVEDLTLDALRHQFEVNVFGTHELTRQIIPIMRNQNEGRIIQNSSLLGLVVLPYRGAYNASKFALEALSDTLRLELVDTNIFVSSIEPGPILSKFRMNSYKMFQKYIDGQHSLYQGTYDKMQKNLLKEGPVMPFTLPPEAVLKRVIYALEAKNPQPHYYVTVPTYVLVTLKRFLPHRLMEWVLRNVV